MGSEFTAFLKNYGVIGLAIGVLISPPSFWVPLGSGR